MRFRALILLAAIGLPLPMLADTTYSYTGNDFTTFVGFVGPSIYNTSDFVSGSFTVSSPLGDNFSGSFSPNSFSFSDGVQTLDDTDSAYSFEVTTDASGNIVDWDILAFVTPYGSGPWFSIETNASGDTGVDFLSGMGTNTSAGVWTSGNVAATPEPGSLALLGTGLLGVAGTVRRKIWRS